MIWKSGQNCIDPRSGAYGLQLCIRVGSITDFLFNYNYTLDFYNYNHF